MTPKRRQTCSNVSRKPHIDFLIGKPPVARAEFNGPPRPSVPTTTIQENIVMMAMDVGKKTLFFNTNLRVSIYLSSLFIISLIGDYKPFPKTYFARRENIFNMVIMKLGWGWTLLLAVPFLVKTSNILCCGGARKKLLLHHAPRIVIANVFYFFWTRLFNWIEASSGKCSVQSFQTKLSCQQAGHLWSSFDISGHAFLLIYSSLLMIEEARTIIKWESIKEEHHSMSSRKSSTNPLRELNAEQMKNFEFIYERQTPTIRALFIGMSALQLLWDAMLVGTIMYYHHMIEKFISGIVAVLTWYFTYRFWYRSPGVLPDPVGSGDCLIQGDRKRVYVAKGANGMTSSATTNGTTHNQSRVAKFMGKPCLVKVQMRQVVF